MAIIDEYGNGLGFGDGPQKRSGFGANDFGEPLDFNGVDELRLDPKELVGNTGTATGTGSGISVNGRPTRNGTRIGEVVGFYRWNGSMWIDNRVTSSNNGNNGLPYVGDLGIGDLSGFGDFKIDIDDIKIDIDIPPIEPINLPFKIHFTSNPSHKKGYQFTDTGAPITPGSQLYPKDLLSGRTIGAKDNGKANEVYSVKTRVVNKGLFDQYVIDFTLNGSLYKSIDSNLYAAVTLPFTWKVEEVPEPTPPPTDVTVDIQHDMASGVSAVLTLQGKTVTFSGTGTSSITNSSGPYLSITPTSNSSYNHLYTLYEDASGKKVFEASQPTFTYTKLQNGLKYKLKVGISKGEIPADPPADPQPDNTPRYRYEKYTVTEKRTTGESAPSYTKPILTLTDGDFVTFNIGEGGDEFIDVPFTTQNADWVNIKTKGKFKKNSYNNKARLSADDFDAPGAYQIWLQPDSNINGTGEAKAIAVQVISKDFLPGPDITLIDFPETIVGEDYKGYNIDFGVNWESINTNYIDIYIGKVSKTTRILKGGPAMGSQQFNIGKILKQAGESLNESRDWVYFDLYFIPYNEEGDELTAGRTESIKIAFDKGNVLLTRPEVMRDITDSICNQFDSDALGKDNSKYLTHLMHFGDGDNKLIATWCTDYEEFSQYEDVVQKVANDEGEYVDQIVRKKTREEETLVFKMYEPLPRSVQPNQQIWVSKIQSIPIIEQVTLINEDLKECIELTPDFGQNLCGENIGFQLYDDIISSGSASSTSVLSEFVSGSGFDLKTLQIPFASSSKEIEGSLLVDSDSTWGWNNFVKYSSAEERVNNFLYKIKLMEFYDTKIEQLESGSYYTGSAGMIKEIQTNTENIQKVKDNFDAFESFLYTSSSLSGLTYPGAGQNEVSHSTDSDSVSWYSSIIDSAQHYDYYNKDLLVNNLPNHVRTSEDSEQFKMFFHMMGNHFDVLWSYTKALAETKNLEHKYELGIKDTLVSSMLKSMGWDAKMGKKAQALWEFAFGENSDGTSTSSMTGKERQQEVWRRLLNNLPYLMKHKGSGRAVKAALACYGVPSSMLTVLEFGGPRNSDGGTSKISFEDRTAAINISGSNSIIVPWKEYTETLDHPQSVEIRVNSEVKQNQTFISSSGWNVGVKYSDVGNRGSIEFQYLSGSTIVSQSTDLMPFFNDEYTQIVVQHLATGSFEVYAKEGFNERIRNAVSMSVKNVPTSSWELDTKLTIGSSTMSGSVDEFRYWTTALSESRIDNHTLLPDAIDGNHHSSSTEDLILRLDFEYPKDRSSSGDTAIKNVSINESYDVDFVTASNFDSITEYPYHYTTYERTVTANVPSSGFGVGNKFRFESQQSINPTEDIDGTGLTLSYRERSTKKSFDTSPIDSNRLGLFFSPIKEINMDMLKSLGQFELDDYIGDPNDRYSDEYRDLRLLRNYYFERYTINLYEYIQLVRYIDQSLFETLESLVPARAIVSSGLLIEPHLLERNKVKHRPLQAEDLLRNIKEPKIDLREQVKIKPENIKRYDKSLKPFDRFKFDVDAKKIRDGRLQRIQPRIRYSRPNYNASIRSVGPAFISSTSLSEGKITDTQFIQRLLKQQEALGGQSQVGVDPRNLRNGLAGVFAKNGIANVTRLDGNGTLIKERKQVWIVTEEYTEIEKQAIPGTGQKTTDGKRWLKEPLYRDVVVTKTRKVVVFNEIGDPAPSGDNILSAVAANSNGGKLPGGNLGNKYGNRGFRSPSRQTSRTTLDRKSPVETFCTNPNILKVSDTARGKGEPILEVNKK
jgi:hypothetical protein